MSLTANVYRFVLFYVLTIYYNVFILVSIFTTSLKNLFSSKIQHKANETPPIVLTDPKYGVHKYATVNGIKLHYVESGDPRKTLMIFLHGYPEFWYSWRNQIINFNKNFWCVALDLRGFGDSERPEGVAAYKADLIAKDVRELVIQLGREKFILISHDWGGLIASRFRDVYPETLLAVVMLASCSIEALHHEIWKNPKQRRQSWYIFFYQAPWIPEYFMQLHGKTVLKNMMLIKGKDTVTEDDIDCYVYCFEKQCGFTSPINYYRANINSNVPELSMCERNIPLLVALPADDIYLNHNLLEVMKKQYNHIETALIENCSHFLQQEDPEKVNQVVEEFLKKHNIE